MGLRAKFNLVILAAFAVGFLIAAIVLNRVATTPRVIRSCRMPAS